MKLIDTTVAVDHLRGQPAAVELLTGLVGPGEEQVARVASQFARRFERSHSGIDAVDYLTVATAIVIDADLLTTNVRHFPMFGELRPPY